MNVAKRYNILRQLQDEYGVQSQLRAAAAAQAGRFAELTYMWALVILIV